MKKRLLSLALVIALVMALLLPTVALSSGSQYIIHDSDKRLLTRRELWGWDYESVGFIFNEIFARHGYNFIIGGPYYNYFHTRPWYTQNANPDNQVACYPYLSSIEWQNERLCKQVRDEMRALGTTNPGGKNYLDYVESGKFDVLSGFFYTRLKPDQKWAVYSAPSNASWRGANGKAMVSTNGSVYVAGWENGWLLLMYETNNGSVRVGYADGSGVKDSLSVPMLSFAYTPVTLTQSVSLTDDPAMAYSSMRQLQAGETVTYLTSYQNRYGWAYVETRVNGQTARGFVPESALNLGFGMVENEDVDYK